MGFYTLASVQGSTDYESDSLPTEPQGLFFSKKYTLWKYVKQSIRAEMWCIILALLIIIPVTFVLNCQKRPNRSINLMGLYQYTSSIEQLFCSCSQQHCVKTMIIVKSAKLLTTRNTTILIAESYQICL